MEQKQKDFMKIILVLKEFYINNFEFSLVDANGKPTRRLELWFQVLGDMDMKVLEFVILDYVKSNIYPPNSPAHILEHYKKMVIGLQDSADVAYQNILTVWRDRKRGNYDKDLTLKHLSGASAETFKAVQGYFTSGATTESLEVWARKEFIERYDGVLESETRLAIKQNKTMLLESDIKLLGGNGNEQV